MPQIILVAWDTAYPEEFGTAWVTTGVAAAALRAVSDGNHASSIILGGASDSNSLWGRQWRQASGLVFPWANRTITNVRVELNLNNNGPEGSSFLAVVSANEPLTYAEQVFNGELYSPVNTPTWITFLNANYAPVKNAILADNFLLSVIHYNHTFPGHTVTAEAARLVVDYIDNIKSAIAPTEA